MVQKILMESLEIVGAELDRIQDDTDLIQDLELDSIAIVDLLMILEEKLQIQVKDMTEFVSCLKSFSELTNYLEVLVSMKGGDDIAEPAERNG